MGETLETKIKFEVDCAYKLNNKTYNPKGETILVTDVIGTQVYYTYLETDELGTAYINGSFLANAELIHSTDNADTGQYLVTHLTYPGYSLAPSLEAAKSKAQSILRGARKGLLPKPVHIYKLHTVAEVEETPITFKEL